ncbi:hypothetical protein G6M89_04550 [Natronolimnobius sp. AArcel1]|uniref:hypothetical protein n=1 Tax=Natronolimnobius sp. AArcel1 TaxID=1679093 RepID=UPI0013EE2DE7|nr:hypothetical protein [Natronolimnobius sp. AArcel1]NGM68286.1 hypothetical protein [Natronolimnobius sp. AArcel1]
MTTRSTGLPSTTAWLLALAGIGGVLAAVTLEPAVALGAVFGISLAAVFAGFDGSYWRIALAAGLLPLAVLGGITTIATGSQLLITGLTIVVAVIALSTGRIVSGPLSNHALNQVGGASITAGFTAGLLGLGALLVADIGGWQPLLEATLWLTGPGLWGIALWAVAGTLALACAITVFPPGAFVSPTEHESYLRARTGLLVLLAVGVVLAGVGVAAIHVASWYVPALRGTLESLATSSAVRGAGAAITAVGVLGVVFAISVRHSWLTVESRQNAAVPILIGASLGTLATFPVVLTISGGTLESVSPIFGIGSVVLGVGWLVSQAGKWVDRQPNTASASVLAVGLLSGGIIAGASIETVRSLGSAHTAAVSFIMIATGLFASNLSRYGRTLARDIGPVASQRPQFVRAGWSALVAGFGVPVAMFGLAFATLFAPTLSVPATAALVVALGAVVVGSRLLFR